MKNSKKKKEVVITEEHLRGIVNGKLPTGNLRNLCMLVDK